MDETKETKTSAAVVLTKIAELAHKLQGARMARINLDGRFVVVFDARDLDEIATELSGMVWLLSKDNKERE